MMLKAAVIAGNLLSLRHRTQDFADSGHSTGQNWVCVNKLSMFACLAFNVVEVRQCCQPVSAYYLVVLQGHTRACKD